MDLGKANSIPPWMPLCHSVVVLIDVNLWHSTSLLLLF